MTKETWMVLCFTWGERGVKGVKVVGDIALKEGTQGKESGQAV